MTEIFLLDRRSGSHKDCSPKTVPLSFPCGAMEQTYLYLSVLSKNKNLEINGIEDHRGYKKESLARWSHTAVVKVVKFSAVESSKKGSKLDSPLCKHPFSLHEKSSRTYRCSLPLHCGLASIYADRDSLNYADVLDHVTLIIGV